MSALTHGAEQKLSLSELHERLGAVRLRSPEAVEAVRGSLTRHGQLTAVTAYRHSADHIEVIDGFKRMQAARELGWTTLRVKVHELDAVGAKAAVMALHASRGLTGLEEG